MRRRLHPKTCHGEIGCRHFRYARRDGAQTGGTVEKRLARILGYRTTHPFDEKLQFVNATDRILGLGQKLPLRRHICIQTDEPLRRGHGLLGGKLNKFPLDPHQYAGSYTNRICLLRKRHIGCERCSQVCRPFACRVECLENLLRNHGLDLGELLFERPQIKLGCIDRCIVAFGALHCLPQICQSLGDGIIGECLDQHALGEPLLALALSAQSADLVLDLKPQCTNLRHCKLHPAIRLVTRHLDRPESIRLHTHRRSQADNRFNTLPVSLVGEKPSQYTDTFFLAVDVSLQR